MEDSQTMPNFTRVKENFMKRLAEEQLVRSNHNEQQPQEEKCIDKDDSRDKDRKNNKHQSPLPKVSKKSNPDDGDDSEGYSANLLAFDKLRALEIQLEDDLMRSGSRFSDLTRQNVMNISPVEVKRRRGHDEEYEEMCNVDSDDDSNRQYDDMIKKTHSEVQHAHHQDYDDSSMSSSSSSMSNPDTESLSEIEPICDDNMQKNWMNNIDESEIGGREMRESPNSPLSTRLTESRSLLYNLLRMQSLAGKGPMCSQFGRSITSLKTLHSDHMSSTFCSTSTESSLAEAISSGDLRKFLKCELELLKRMKMMLPLEDGDSFLRSNDVDEKYKNSGELDGEDDPITPFGGSAMNRLIQLHSTTLSNIEKDENEAEMRQYHSNDKKHYRYADCVDDEDNDRKEPGLVNSEHAKLCAQLQVSASSLGMLSLTGRIFRAEQRITALRRLYHQKSSRLAECEDKLMDNVDTSLQYQVEIDQMKLRIGSLIENLNYHRNATERVQDLEESLMRMEAEKNSALDELARIEQIMKRRDQNRLDSNDRSGRHATTYHSVPRPHLALDEGSIYSDDDMDDFDFRSVGNSDAKVTDSRHFDADRSQRGHKASGNEVDRKGSPQQLLKPLEWGARQNVEGYFTEFTDEELTKLTSTLNTMTRKVEKAKLLSIERKERELADSKSSSEQSLCCICRDAVKTILLMPCRHLCLCENCSNALKRRRGNCPVCRQVVIDCIKVYA